ncbi:MAG: hypothetical protein H0T56_15915 [Pseudaminobacter sp.]|nr:hypothetical protein [Pseudaminobacter sp.]
MGMLASLIAGFASGETVLAVSRAKRATLFFLLAALAAFCGLGFLVGAGYILMAERFGSVEAALGMGLGFLALAGIILLFHKVSSRVRARRSVARRNSEMTSVAVASGLAVLPFLLRRKAGLGVAIAPAIALAAYAIFRENRKPQPREPDTDPD